MAGGEGWVSVDMEGIETLFQQYMQEVRWLCGEVTVRIKTSQCTEVHIRGKC